MNSRAFIYLGCTFLNVGGKEMDSAITTKVEIADQTGHTTCQLTKSETLEKVSDSPGSWVFADGQMVQSQQLENADWATVGTVRIVPGLVGGS